MEKTTFIFYKEYKEAVDCIEDKIDKKNMSYWNYIEPFFKNQKLRFDTNNGIVLCNLYHRKVHKNEQRKFFNL